MSLRRRTDEEVGACRRRPGLRPASGPSRGSRSRSRSRCQSSSPVLGERATTTPRMRPSTRACGAAMITSASPSPERSGTGITQWPKSPSGESPSHVRISAPVAPDHTAALPFWQRPLLQLEARAGGDVGVTVAVDVERLAEAEPELTPRDAARRSAAPRTSRRPERSTTAWRRGARNATLAIARQQRRRRRDDRESRRRRHARAGDAGFFTDSSLPSSCRRGCTAGSIWSDPRTPVALVSATF